MKFSTAGPTDPVRADGQTVGQPSGCITDRHRRTEKAKVPQAHHAHVASTTGLFQGDDQPLHGRCAHLKTFVQHHR